MIWDEAREARLIEVWRKMPVRQMAVEFQTSTGAIYRQARKLKLKTTSKYAARALASNHRAIVRGRPRHERFLVTAETSPKLLVSGKESRKIGGRVTKGRWMGMPIYTLTLAERLTCPRACALWDSCYGNNMNWARRHVLDRDLIERLRWELTALAARHPAGFVVRPHVLGDFGSGQDPELALEYAAAWLRWLGRFEGLHVFGYTAHPPATPVGEAVMRLNRKFPERCRIRFSGTARGGFGALVIEREADSRHVVCPQELGKTESCGTCGLCWTMTKTVEFLKH